MAGSSFGEAFRISTWGESHGAALGVVVDGVPAGLRLDTNRIQEFMDRRNRDSPSLRRRERKQMPLRCLSGVFEGKTTGTPIPMMVRNADQHSRIIPVLRNLQTGACGLHFYEKYGIEIIAAAADPSGRETIGRVAAGGDRLYRF